MGKRSFYGKAEQGPTDNIIDESNTQDDVSSTNKSSDGLTTAMTDQEKNKRKRKMKETLLKNHQEKASRQKRKRMDKYIEHQLKREEKEILFKKLEETRIDSSMLKSAKLLGTGSTKTKREQFLEALELEKQGKGTDETKEILYEERTIKKWDDSDNEDFPSGQAENEEEFKSTDDVGSGFIDYRPAQPFTGIGTGFGFGNIAKVEKKVKRVTKNYSWRAKIEAEEKKKSKTEDDQDFDSSSDEEVFDEDDSEDVSQNVEKKTSNDKTKIESEEDDDNESDEDKSSEEEDSSEQESESEEEEEDEEESVVASKHSERAQGFKEWAEQQTRIMEQRTEFVAPTAPQADYTPIVREEDLNDGLEQEYIPINEDLKRKVFTVEVERDDSIQQSRMQLPVYAEEHRIMEAIHHNDCVIICGETGSGKTTQVPQFLFESGYGNPQSETPGMIGVTQPRRVAAVAMSERVGNELGNHSSKVGYQIRFDATVKSTTALKFMTDGVLLREMMTDFLLTKYSALIIDEAHERNINTDILIGMLSRVLKLRREYHEKNPTKYTPLKLVIMSATLRVSDFSENKVLFDTPPPILKVDARQYPVSIHFNKRTAFNYTEEAFNKTCKIHKRLPPGGILVFLTGKAEITAMVKRLRARFPTPTTTKNKGSQKYIEEDIPELKVSAKNADVEAEEIDFEVNEMIDDFNDEVGESGDDEEEEEEGFEETLEEGQTDNDPLYILPLYSLLPTKEQMKVFEEPPAGARLCVIATNVAETSLTIPGIRYVVDCGRSKERHFNEDTGVQSFEVGWISKASSDQRAGRAGRTGPGHCYRLFSSAVYMNDFPQFSKPEILRMPVESVVLSMKSMGIDTISNFPFPTPPDRLMLHKAEMLLQYLGALNDKKTITDLGRTMSLFPLSPRFSKMLIIGNQLECLPYVIALVSGLSVGDPFLSEFELEDEEENPKDIEFKRQTLSKYNKSSALFTKLDKSSDAMKLLSVICALDHIPINKREAFFENNFLRAKVMEETSKLRKQLTYIVKVNTTKESIASTSNVEDKDLKLGKPSKQQIQAIKQMITSGFVDQIAVRADTIDREVKITNNSNIINVPYLTLFPSSASKQDNLDKFVYIHPSSILTKSGELPPQFLIYQSLNLGANQVANRVSKLRFKPLTDITGKALANVAKNSSLITYSKPLGHPYSPKDISPTERECYVIPRIGAAIGSGGVGWDLPVVKVKQKKVMGSWVIQ
ncbi:hypothetical protein CANARDRAFT_232743 [[Candida] arabinofermentans NRRL YB-2248]|uniref:RNA helicase n=1 Tax=[Candida] arabinofermentans NRRL YB-2248 TaxID=983967 RepID=A0A1E4T235_9ASCO|nr:hypothetical protein CANARDRAFT_232743 [[Candida] arabinofermentans NRRL YB-2248]